ncbi:MAG: hypothetical protein AB1405_11375 [Bdellovibrionota bacterium]
MKRLAAGALLWAFLLNACAFKTSRMEAAGAFSGAVQQKDSSAASTKLTTYTKLKRRPFTSMIDSGAKEQAASLEAALTKWSGAGNDCDRNTALSELVQVARGIPDFEVALVTLESHAEEEAKKLKAALSSGADEVEKLGKEGKHVEAEKKIGPLLDRCPQDARLTALYPKVQEAARFERSAKSEKHYDSKRPAAGYMLSLLDPLMTTSDRVWSQDRHLQEIETLKEKMEVTVVVEPAGGLAGQLRGLLEGKDRNVAVSTARPFSERTYSFTLIVSEPALEFPEPFLARAEPATSKYVSGTQWVPNPEKAKCTTRVQQLQNAQFQAQQALQQAQWDYNNCVMQARQCQQQANQIGGWGGIAASVACGVGEGVCSASLSNAQTAAQTADADYYQAVNQCNATPQLVQENIYADQPYVINHWAVKPAGKVHLQVREGGASGSLYWEGDVAHTFTIEDTVVEGQPQYNIQGDALTLPGKDQLQPQLLAELANKSRTEVASNVLRYWRNILEKASRAGDDGTRRELVSQMLLLKNLSGQSEPEWDKAAEKFERYLLKDEK